MDAILMSLMAALNEKLLINVYQRDTDDFYTGYVQALGSNAVILSTYNDAGISDGAVLLTFNAIEQVEFAGADLDDMDFRIDLAERAHFLTLEEPATLKFDPTQDLLQQLAQQAQASQQVVMVILADDDSFLEGQITSVFEDRFTLSVFNKYNYTDVRVMQIDCSDVLVVEFAGLDLFLETQLVAQRAHLVHQKSELHLNNGQLAPILADAEKSGAMLAAIPRDNEDQFYIGTVKALNHGVVVLSLLDMAAQFGGYVALRIAALQSLITASDYLQTIAFYRQWDEAHDFTQQPVLNADRDFDNTAELIPSLVSEAAAFQRVIRVRAATEEDHLMGIPQEVSASGFVMRLTDGGEPENVPVAFDDVLELAFGHIFAYIAEETLHQDGR
ncbi:hypothetical protein [Lacticaseibacillus mingshuiensis]|uniref:hypothetical protein n=1 Tax=Lacticaseibacillus mingshuiensis TaxID=2799574 RepID=UPI00194EECAE|nr:hypothetical protein [Lacticaseibacillus mingshuiensis]